MRYLSGTWAAIVLLMVSLVAGCGATIVSQSWKAPDFAGPSLRRVMVVAFPADPKLRHHYEDAFVAELAGAGVQGVAGYTVVENLNELNTSAAMQAAREAGADAVLVAEVVAKYVQPTYQPASLSLSGEDNSAISAADRSIVGTNEILLLKSRLFRVQDRKLLWVGTTQTHDAARLGHAIEDVAHKVTAKLESEKII